MQAVARMEKELGLSVDPRRYVHETLDQLIRASTPAPAPPEPAGGSTVDTKGGLSSRFRGLFGRGRQGS